MNIPEGWIVAVGSAVAGAFYYVWKLIERYWDKRETEIDRLIAKQDKCEEHTRELYGRVEVLEADHPAKIAAIHEVGERIINETAAEVVARLQKEKQGNGT